MKRLQLLFCLAALLAACSPTGLDPENISYDDGSDVEHELLVLGEKLEDPYTVENMTKALQVLYPTKATVVTLTPTDNYVRLLPGNEDDIRLLEEMGVQMLDHPLDYSIVKEGDYYHDPDIPEEDITWQYAVVPPDFEAPDWIECELLDECFIPSENATKSAPDWIDWDAVENMAFELTGNSSMISAETKAGGKPSYPAGRITIVDADYDIHSVGLKGVKVSCNVFVKFARAFTDEEGYYEMEKSFTSDPRYRIEFTNRKGFSQGINLIMVKGSISTLGKHSAKGYNLLITKNSEAKLWRRSVINNAAYDYYESCVSNGVKIATPPANLRIWSCQLLEGSAAPMLQQGPVLDFDMVQSLLGEYTPIIKMFLPDIVLGLKNKTSYPDIYRSVIHEIAHASHYMRVGNEYWDNVILHIVTSYMASGGVTYGIGNEDRAGYCAVSEMWAYYVENVLYRERYGATDKFYGGKYWFSPQILMYLDERGMNRFKIFVALTSDVHSVDALRSRLLSLYPESKSMINEAFNKYL